MILSCCNARVCFLVFSYNKCIKEDVPFLAIFPTNSYEAAEVDLLSTPRVEAQRARIIG
jgi:hypothetical protein